MSHRQINPPEPSPVLEAEKMLLVVMALTGAAVGLAQYLWETPRLAQARDQLRTHLRHPARIPLHLGRLLNHQTLPQNRPIR
jgi:hypothetical protein